MDLLVRSQTPFQARLQALFQLQKRLHLVVLLLVDLTSVINFLIWMKYTYDLTTFSCK